MILPELVLPLAVLAVLLATTAAGALHLHARRARRRPAPAHSAATRHVHSSRRWTTGP